MSVISFLAFCCRALKYFCACVWFCTTESRNYPPKTGDLSKPSDTLFEIKIVGKAFTEENHVRTWAEQDYARCELEERDQDYAYNNDLCRSQEKIVFKSITIT